MRRSFYKMWIIIKKVIITIKYGRISHDIYKNILYKNIPYQYHLKRQSTFIMNMNKIKK